MFGNLIDYRLSRVANEMEFLKAGGAFHVGRPKICPVWINRAALAH